MRKSERIEKISEILNEYFPNPDVPLNHSDPYTLLVAVLLSAQCTDERVNLITPKLFKKAKSPEKMALLKENEIYKIIKPCGLGPKKSKAIKDLSDILVEHMRPITAEVKKLMQDKAYLIDILREGQNKANKVAQKTISDVYDIVGLLR